jgi:glycosyltransferase involved in cell wall biosynthesis
MRLLQVIQELDTGGAERVVAALTAGSRSAGHEVATAAAPGALEDDVGGELFELPIVGRRPTRIPAAARALRRAIRDWKPDLLHCHNPGMAVVASLVTFRGRTRPALVTVHGVPDEDYGAAARLLRTTGLPVVACGPGVEQGLAERGLRLETTIVNGIGGAPPPADRDALHTELGLQPGHRLVAAVGRLVGAKNHALAIAAVSQVPDTALVILGEGPLRAELEAQIREDGLADRVVLAGVRRDSWSIVAAADAFVLASRAEGLPLAALEALAAGTPVAATAVRGIRELLVHQETALLTRPDDAQALARSVASVLDNRALADRLATAGQILAAGYTEEAMVDRYLRLYEQIVGSRRA